MSRLVVVSNRVALPRSRGVHPGGLAVALKDALSAASGLWFGWSGDVAEQPAQGARLSTSGGITYATADLSPEEHAAFYLGYANSTLWPLFHYRLGLLDFQRHDLTRYLQVNERFAGLLAPMLRPDDTIWVHDYHFIPLAAMLRRRGVTNRIGFFLHIPFPVPEVLTALPGHDTLMREIMDYDLIGFQTRGHAQAFTRYMVEEAGGSATSDGRIMAYGRSAVAGVFPIGIETEEFEKLSAKAAEGAEIEQLRASLTGRNLIIGVDRLDYSKGLPKRFEAFRDLLQRYPEHRREVTFMQIAPVSRGEIARYSSLRREIERVAGRINGEFAEFDWVPIRYLNKPFPRQTLAAFYRAARIGLVTPLQDGMNLVAKEFVAAQDPEDPGVLVLSRFAGAADELRGALRVNPFDPEHVADTIHQALRLPLAERQQRFQSMLAVLLDNTVADWRKRFLRRLAAIAPANEAPRPIARGEAG